MSSDLNMDGDKRKLKVQSRLFESSYWMLNLVPIILNNWLAFGLATLTVLSICFKNDLLISRMIDVRRKRVYTERYIWQR